MNTVTDSFVKAAVKRNATEISSCKQTDKGGDSQVNQDRNLNIIKKKQHKINKEGGNNRGSTPIFKKKSNQDVQSN